MLADVERRPLYPGEYVAPYYKTPDRVKLSCNPDGPNDIVWSDASYYAPTKTTNYADHTPTPPFSQQRQTMNFRTEGDWLDYVRNRDQPSGLYCPSVALRMLRDPALHLNAYHQAWDHRAPPGFNPYRTDYQWKYRPSRPKHPPQRPPYARGHAPYLGYYHEKFHKEIIPQRPEEYGNYVMGPLEEMPPNLRGKWEGFYDRVFENERNRRHHELPVTNRLCSNIPFYVYQYNRRWGFNQP